MKNVLIISGHPDLNQSVGNKIILDEVAAALPEANIRKLDSLYPNWQFDIAAEQDALRHADVIVWQFPFSWYSMPALLKKWLDEVFVHGFSHGSKGAPKEAYAPDAIMKHHVEDYCSQFESTAILCGLDLQSIVYTNGISYSARQSEEQIAAQKALAREHAKRLIAAIDAA